MCSRSLAAHETCGQEFDSTTLSHGLRCVPSLSSLSFCRFCRAGRPERHLKAWGSFEDCDSAQVCFLLVARKRGDSVRVERMTSSPVKVLMSCCRLITLTPVISTIRYCT